MSIPVISVKGRNIPQAWESSLLELWNSGISIRTEYDSEGVPPSKDATMVMTIEEPYSEPRIHMCIPGGLEDLRKYVREVVDGVHDDWIDPKQGKWIYTYHQRLFGYEMGKDTIDQVNFMITKLTSAPHSRRAQAITWNPMLDPLSYDPPCLQRIWGRCVSDEKGKMWFNMNAHWRSRDAYKAAFMNLFALTELQRIIARRISEKAGNEIFAGRYVDISDSYHIYGSDFNDFRIRFLAMIGKRKFFNDNLTDSRTLRSDHPLVLKAFAKADDALLKEKSTGRKGTTG